MSDALPSGFEELQPFVAKWAVEGTAARAALRGDSTPDERQAFYDAAAPLSVRALDHLDARPWGEYGEAELRLMNLMLSFAHVSIAIEIQQGDEERHAAARRHMHITRSPADEPAAC